MGRGFAKVLSSIGRSGKGYRLGIVVGLMANKVAKLSEVPSTRNPAAATPTGLLSAFGAVCWTGSNRMVQPRFNTQWGRVFLERSVTKRVHPWGLVQHKGENRMKVLISTFAMAIALAFTGPAFAGEVSKAKTEADCQKHGGMWDAKTNTCSEKKM